MVEQGIRVFMIKIEYKSPLFPQGITEFTNAKDDVGAATVNFSAKP